MIDTTTIVNVLWSASIWLLAPLFLALILQRRHAVLQRTVIRGTLLLLPIPIVLALGGWQLGRGWIEPPHGAVDSSAESAEFALTEATLPDIGTTPSAQSELATEAAERWANEPQTSPLTEVPDFHPQTSALLATSSDGAYEPRDDQAAWPEDAGFTVPGAALRPAEAASSGSNDSTLSSAPALLVVFVAIWAVGAALGLVRLITAWRQLSGWTRRTSADPSLTARSRALAARLGYQRPVRTCVSPTLQHGFASGIARPRIVVPASWLRELEPKQIDPLLLHEIAHVKGRDPLWRLLLAVASATLWPHPLIHFLRRREEFLSELIADAAAVGATADRKRYARVLGTLAGALPQPKQTAIAIAPGVLGQTSQLERRIQMILRSSSSTRPLRAVAVAACTLLLLTLVAARPLVGQPADNDPVEVSVRLQGEWWVARGHTPGKVDDILWIVRLCPVKGGEMGTTVDVRRHGSHAEAVVGVDGKKWRLDLLTGQTRKHGGGMSLPSVPAPGVPGAGAYGAVPPVPTTPNTLPNAAQAPRSSLYPRAATTNDQVRRALERYERSLQRDPNAAAEARKRITERLVEAETKIADLAAQRAELESQTARLQVELDRATAQKQFDRMRKLESDLADIAKLRTNLAAKTPRYNQEISIYKDLVSELQDQLRAADHAEAAATALAQGRMDAARAALNAEQAAKAKEQAEFERGRAQIEAERALIRARDAADQANAARRMPGLTNTRPLNVNQASDDTMRQLLNELRAIRSEVQQLRNDVEQNRQALRETTTMPEPVAPKNPLPPGGGR